MFHKEVVTPESFRKNIFAITCCGNSIHFRGKITYVSLQNCSIYVFLVNNDMRTALLSLNSFMTEMLRKTMDWFLYDNGLGHERVNINHKTK